MEQKATGNIKTNAQQKVFEIAGLDVEAIGSKSLSALVPA